GEILTKAFWNQPHLDEVYPTGERHPVEEPAKRTSLRKEILRYNHQNTFQNDLRRADLGGFQDRFDGFCQRGKRVERAI
ncbi:hypothetical protein HDV05_004736, partial [Chytridiales sp. JEL 0842]